MAIKIITTGGTIDKQYFDQKSEYQVEEPQISGILERANVVVDYEIVEVLRKDSLEMNDEDRAKVRSVIESDSADKFIVTHGTDTMVNTANALGKLEGKTVVLTGSMYPAQYRDSDAVFNVGCALIAVQTLPPGVYIAINGRIFDPKNTLKNVELSRFEQNAT